MSVVNLQAVYDSLECVALDTHSRELQYDVIPWFDHPSDGKRYGCISVECERIWFESEKRRGQCTFTKHRDLINHCIASLVLALALVVLCDGLQESRSHTQRGHTLVSRGGIQPSDRTTLRY
jgi:hypothetical protein